MSLMDFLTSLNLSAYYAPISMQGITELETLFTYSDAELDQLLSAAGMLKGHMIKFKKSLDTARTSTPSPSKKRAEETPKAKTVTATQSPVQALNREAERMMGKLKEVEQLREDIRKCEELVLTIDIDKYRDIINKMDFYQRTIRSMEDTGEQEEQPTEIEPAPMDIDA